MNALNAHAVGEAYLTSAALSTVAASDGSNLSATALRLKLLANGWTPLPITAPDYQHPTVQSPGKQPFFKGWQKIGPETLTADTIRAWQHGISNHPGTGLICGLLSVADIDVLDAGLVEKLKALAFKIIGPTPFLRIGKSPKLALMYRLAEPAKKMMTPFFAMPDGTDARVEILGAGQQVVGYGIHPNTGRPYEWPRHAPDTHSFDSVPLAAQPALLAFLMGAEVLLRKAGGIVKADEKKAPKAASKPATGTVKPTKPPIPSDFPPPTSEDVASALAAIPSADDWHTWHKIGGALFDALADDGESLFHEWSAGSTKYQRDECAAKWKSYGSSPSTVKAATLFFEARKHGWKPERERERDKARQERAAQAAKVAADPTLELTEDGVALAFAQKHADALRYCHDTGGWYVWTGTHWRLNKDKIAFSFARQLVRSLNRDAEFKTKAITGKAAFAGAVEKFAQSDRTFAVTGEAWDTALDLIGTPGGVVNLRTGELRPAERGDMMTKVTAVAPAGTADCPTWLAFLDQATAGDAELIRFLQQWAGYCLSGSTREHALLFIYGTGGNGKSVFLNTLSHILGDYCRSAPMDTFTASPGDKHPTDLAMLRGARLVTATETEEGRAWAEARIKQMTGGDPVTARFMRQDFFTYTPQFKLTIAGNHKPALKNVDDAARRRFNIVPFLHKPERPDHQLEHKLKAEAPGILRWIIEGCLDWQRHGLVRPKIVTDATAEYFEAQDTIGRWLAERCIIDPSLGEKSGRLLKDLQEWSQENGEPVTDNRKLRGILEKTPGCRFVTVNGSPLVRGIGLRTASRVGGGGVYNP